MDMNIKKYVGVVLTIIGGIGMTMHLLALPMALVGILFFIQGAEDEVIKKTIRCIQETKASKGPKPNK
jgi:hypothetical protein